MATAALLATTDRPLYSLATEKPKFAKKQGVTGRVTKHAATMIELVTRPATPSLTLFPDQPASRDSSMDAVTETLVPGTTRSAIHPSAIVSPKAELGEGVRIGPYCTVGPNAVIEDGAELVSHVVVDGHTRIGPGAVLYPFCTVGLAPQDLKYKDEP
ncbi:MAG: hypothetical protein ACREPS_10425, partial [Rhodanobacteraceae bacterium]